MRRNMMLITIKSVYPLYLFHFPNLQIKIQEYSQISFGKILWQNKQHHCDSVPPKSFIWINGLLGKSSRLKKVKQLFQFNITPRIYSKDLLGNFHLNTDSKIHATMCSVVNSPTDKLNKWLLFEWSHAWRFHPQT